MLATDNFQVEANWPQNVAADTALQKDYPLMDLLWAVIQLTTSMIVLFSHTRGPATVFSKYSVIHTLKCCVIYE